VIIDRIANIMLQMFHWNNKHGRKGEYEDVETDEKVQQEMKDYVNRETDKMIANSNKPIEQTFTSPQKAANDDAEEEVSKEQEKADTSGEKTPENKEEATSSTKMDESDNKKNDNDDEKDMDISEDVLNSLCKEATDNTEKKGSEDNKMEQGEPSSTHVNEQESEATVSEKSENAATDKSEGAAADKFKWKDHPDANEIAINGIKKKESPSQIMQSLNDKGIKPTPTSTAK